MSWWQVALNAILQLLTLGKQAGWYDQDGGVHPDAPQWFKNRIKGRGL